MIEPNGYNSQNSNMFASGYGYGNVNYPVSSPTYQ